MERIYNRDVRRAFAHHIDTLERYGISYDGRLVLSQGSKTYGNAWRINRIPTGESYHANPPIGSDYLGMTAREAYDTLHERNRTIHDMASALGLPRFETARDRAEASLAQDVQS